MQTTTLICNNFSGINRTSAVYSSQVITASDIDNIAADLNAKADADLSNILASKSAKTEIVSWGIPDYTSMVTITSPHTVLADGIVMANYDSGANPTINNVEIPVIGNDSNNEGPYILYVRKNDVITLTGHYFRFVPFRY